MTAIYIGAFIVGCAAGWLLLKITKFLICKRVDYSPKSWIVNGKKVPILWILVTSIVYLGFTIIYGINLNTLEYVFVFSMCLVISAVDFCIQRIPNGILFSILTGVLLFMALGNSYSGIINHLLGLVVGLTIFLLPFIFGKQSGGGDVKYAAVIGFSLGLYYSIIALLIMSVALLIYTVILLSTKKGGLRTKAAMGPYMSLGFVTAFIMMGNVI